MSLGVKGLMGHSFFNPINAELNPICNLLALLEAHHILHVSKIRGEVVSRPTSYCSMDKDISRAPGYDRVLLILTECDFSVFCNVADSFNVP